MAGEGYVLIDRDEYFATAVSQLMGEMGLNYDRFTVDEMHQLYAAAVEHEQAVWDEFMLWIACGDDKRERTRILLRAQMMKNRRPV